LDLCHATPHQANVNCAAKNVRKEMQQKNAENEAATAERHRTMLHHCHQLIAGTQNDAASAAKHSKTLEKIHSS